MEKTEAVEKKKSGVGWFWALLAAMFFFYMAITLYGAARTVLGEESDTVYEVDDADKNVRCFVYRDSIACVPYGSENAAAEKLQLPTSSLQSRQVASACTPLGIQPNPNSCHRH